MLQAEGGSHMGALLMVSMLALAADESAASSSAAIQGRWQIVYAEEGGRRDNSWEQRQATISGDTLKYEADGREHSIELKLGQQQALEASESGGKSHRGVYIVGRDYLCISLESGRFGSANRGEAQERGTAKAGGRERSSGSFILI